MKRPAGDRASALAHAGQGIGRKQGRGVLEYLVAVANAPLLGTPPPALIAAPRLPG